jgi:error-prone DNA polymerase
VADRNSLAGVVRAHAAAKRLGLPLLVGARLVPRDGPELLCFPRDRAAYGRLSTLLTLGKRRAEKGQCHLDLADIEAAAEGQCLVVLPPARPDAAFAATLRRLAGLWPGRAWLAAACRLDGGDRRRLAALASLARQAGLPLLAHNDAVMHAASRKPLADVLACIREKTTIDQAGFHAAANAERHLKPPAEMARLFADHPQAIGETMRLAQLCRFSLDELKYEYPDEIAPDGRPPQQVLVEETWAGAARRYPGGVPAAVRRQIEHELVLVEKLDYARFFLTVHDAVRFARGQGILCQGRGSAANSAVCYCLGITAVDPARLDLLFERFVSEERREPPDIDVDFEHERREEVIQYIYRRYGRERAGLAATVICYRTRAAVRDVGKALGLAADTIEAISGNIWGWSLEGVAATELEELGLDPTAPRLSLLIELVRELVGFPRHLSQHVGGFVITKGPLHELVPIENAAMENRTVIEWDKDDLESLGLLKVDILALGMLTCLGKAFALIQTATHERYDLASIPPKDGRTYDMLCRADSIGVFQVESRAQMAMLPRLQPRDFYDLVIEVAIVRPGPIQGDMVHPYLRRRAGEEPVSFPSPELARVLGKTLGVPLFQEQAMKIAIVAAGFSPGEADRLRRAMATFKNVGTIHTFRDKLIEGMVAKGYERDFAERCFRQIEGFGTYGFPESHAASFALLVYVSAWIKCHYPAVFACALLNSQPLGFYAPAQIVRDAREHGVAVLPLDLNASQWDCTLEPAPAPVGDFPRQLTPRRDLGYALRLGFRQAKGLAEAEVAKLLAARGNGYRDPLQLWRRAGLRPATLEALARADAFAGLGLTRREALWAVKGLAPEPLPLFAAMQEEEQGAEPAVSLPRITPSQEVVEDYRHLALTLRAHPLSFLREGLAAERYRPAAALAEAPNGRRLAVAGLVLVRQRPGSAKGVIFATLEDETGVANAVIWPHVFERFRRVVLGASLLGVVGRVQKEGLVIHLVAERLLDLSDRLHELTARVRDIVIPDYPRPGEPPDAQAARALTRAQAPVDEVRRPGQDQRDKPRRRLALQPSRDFH